LAIAKLKVEIQKIDPKENQPIGDNNTVLPKGINIEKTKL